MNNKMRSSRFLEILEYINELSQDELEDLKAEVIELYKEREYLAYEKLNLTQKDDFSMEVERLKKVLMNEQPQEKHVQKSYYAMNARK